jgi:hypothetical protein
MPTKNCWPGVLLVVKVMLSRYRVTGAAWTVPAPASSSAASSLSIFIAIPLWFLGVVIRREPP